MNYKYSICFVNPTKLQRPIYVTARLLADRGWKATIIQPSPSISRYPDWLDIPVIPLRCRYVPEIRYAIPDLLEESQIISELIEKGECDLVHVQDYFTLPAIPPIRIRRRYNIPITLLNNALVGYGWAYGKTAIDLATRMYTRLVGGHVLKSYDHLFFFHMEMLTRAEQLFGRGLPPREVLSIGVDSQKFHCVDAAKLRQELGLEARDKVILFVGRLVNVKRVEWVIDACAKLRESGYPAVVLVIGGGNLGNQRSEEHYRQLAQPLGDAVRFLGPQTQDVLLSYYSLADVVVQPSISEGISNTLLEAAACESICVASAVGGTTDIIVHGETGWVFDPTNFEEFVGYVKQALGLSPEQRSAMGHNARRIVLSRFNWSAIVDRYEAVFSNLIESRRHTF